MWDPFFGDGTRRVITSDVSQAWPVADAGLGAVTYLLEALPGIMGDRRRWRTMPWMVAMFGLLVIPLGGVSIFFIVIQPIAIGTWCTLCLVSAAAMVVMLPYAFDEIVASFQFLVREKRRGASLARPLRALNFLFGGWLLLAPWVLEGATVAGTMGVMLAGTALVALALPRGPVLHRYAGWDRLLAW